MVRLSYPESLGLYLQRLIAIYSAIFSTAEAEDHKTAYVKGGLFTKNGTELPPPGAEIFWHRREKWEEPTSGIKPQ